MIAVIQRVAAAEVFIDGKLYSSIKSGLLVLLGIGHEDEEEELEWLAQKIINLRIFSDEEAKMNLSLKNIQGDLLLVSQFTLLANTKKGNRPSFIRSARPEQARPLYEKMIQTLEDKLNKPISTGQFGAMMDLKLTNEGPVTIVIDTKNRI